MACDFARDQLSAYHDGQLDARDKAAVEGHLAQCGDCRRELEEVRSASRLVQSLGRARAPEWLAKNIQDEIARSAAPPRVVKFRRYVEAALACAAGILLVMSVVHLASGPAERRGTPAPDMAVTRPPETRSKSAETAQPPAPTGLKAGEVPVEPPGDENLPRKRSGKYDAETARPTENFVQKNAQDSGKAAVPPQPPAKVLKEEDSVYSKREPSEADKSFRCMLVFTEDDSAVRRLLETQMKTMGAEWSSKDMCYEAELSADEAQALVRKLQEVKATCSEEPLVASAHDSLKKLQNDCWSDYRAREQRKELAKKTEDSRKTGDFGGTPTAKAQMQQAQDRPDPEPKDVPAQPPAPKPSSEPAEDKVAKERSVEEAEKARAPELRRYERGRKSLERWRFYIMPKDVEALKLVERLRREPQGPAKK